MNLKKYYGIVIAVIALTSCTKTEYLYYNDADRIQFGPIPSKIYSTADYLSDTTKNFTFVYVPATSNQDTVFFDIYSVGKVSDKDRTYTLQQMDLTDGSTNAVAGTDYKSFTDPALSGKYVIKAGQSHARVPIVLLRSTTLKTKIVTLKFSVVENENFKTGEKTHLWRKVIFTDMLSQPTAWSPIMSQYYFGAYSNVKHRFMISATNQKWDQDFINSLFTDMGLFNFYINQCKSALISYNQANPTNPLRDENGQLVTFP